jgi:hypothetical protein
VNGQKAKKRRNKPFKIGNHGNTQGNKKYKLIKRPSKAQGRWGGA